MRWWTSDLHLGHLNIIRYCRRPVPDVDAMAAALIDVWNAAVEPDDEVWVLGDYAMGQLVDTLPLTKCFQGRKVLVPGNHDRPWVGWRPAAGEARMAEARQRYLDAGFDAIVDGPVQVDIGGVAVTADHFPFQGDSHEADRFVEFRPVDRGQWLLHGHVHDRWRQWGRMINVGVDAWAGRPVSDDDVAALIAAGPADREAVRRPWVPLAA